MSLSADFRAAESVYMNTVKQLLCIRKSVCNDIVLVELGIGDAQSFVRQQQASFLRKLRNRDSFNGSYLDQIIQMALNSKSASGVALKRLSEYGTDHATSLLNHWRHASC